MATLLNKWDDCRDMTAVCPRCRLPRTPEGHDPCIRKLPGVTAACCGHGVRASYVLFADGRVIDGIFRHLDDDQTTAWHWLTRRIRKFVSPITPRG